MAAKLIKNDTKSHLFLVELRMMFEPTMIATKKISITMEKCPAVTTVRTSLAVPVSMMGSERRPGFATFGVQATTITMSSFPSSGITVQ